MVNLRSRHFAKRLWCLFTSFALLFMCVLGCTKKPDLSATTKIGTQTSGPKEPRILGTIPEFSLVDQNGDAFQSESLRGKLWVATFIFTRCGQTCPQQTAGFTTLQADLGKQSALGRVKLVSLTVDPEFDTAKVLAEYGQKANADFANWTFLTGDRGTLWDLSKESFKLDVTSGRDATSIINHSQMYVLIDDQSQIRGYYKGLDEKANEQLRADIEILLDSHAATIVSDVNYPKDVQNPAWVAERAEKQKQTVAASGVYSDFGYSDRRVESGITFKDEVVDDVKRFFKASHYDHGSGIAVADVDGDELLDVYFVSQFGQCQLWKNSGDGTFTDITSSAGVGIDEEVTVGASFADIDNDGDADLYVTRVRAPNCLFVNDGKGRFKEAAAERGLDHVGHSSGSVFFDYDRDGLLDLLLTNVGKYTSNTRLDDYYVAYQAAFTGHLHESRHEANLLFHNEGDGKFRDVSQEMGFVDKSWSGDASPIDANEDGWPDIYLLNMQGHDEYYENQQGKGFVKRSRELFPQTAWGTMGVKVFDYDRDGKLDLYVTDMHTDMVHKLKPDEEKSKMRRNLPDKALATDGNHILGNAFLRKTGKDTYEEISDKIGAENYWPWGISVADLNADGYEDVFVASSMNYPFRYAINSVLLNDAGKKFVDAEYALGVEPREDGSAQFWMDLDCAGDDSDNRNCVNCNGQARVFAAKGSRSSVVFDIENDGDLDVITNDFGGRPMVLVSDLSERTKPQFLKLQLVGTKSNRDAFGALVTVQHGYSTQLFVHDGKSGYLSQSRLPLYVGLGDSKTVDSVEITWPSGETEKVAGPIESNQLITITEGSSES